jgi:hypothetical protein
VTAITRGVRAGFLLALGAVALAGCTLLGDLEGEELPSVTAELEILNRTEVDLLYLAADGERLLVPACGSATDETFRIDRVEVRTEDGYVRTFGVGAAEFEGQRLVLVETVDAQESGLPVRGPAPVPPPPCQGIPPAQVGV